MRSRIINTDLQDMGFSIVRKSDYERTTCTGKEKLTAEKEYDFDLSSDRKEVLSIMAKTMIFGPIRMEEGLKQLKRELEEVFEEIKEELPFL